MLVHLQAFNSLPENYMIPESTKNGVPLFYIPPGSTTPVRCLAELNKCMIHTHTNMHFISTQYSIISPSNVHLWFRLENPSLI